MGVRVVAVIFLLLLATGCGRQVGVQPAQISTEEVRDVCARLIEELPTEISAGRAWSVSPDPASTAAWGSPAVVLTCGDPTAAADPAAQLLEVDSVTWVVRPLTDGDEYQTTQRVATVTVRIPVDYAPTATTLTEIAPAVRVAVPATD